MALKEPACEPSPSAKSSPIAEPSSPSTGQTSRATPTSVSSQQTDWLPMESSPMSSAEDFPAKTYRSPERVLVLQARGAVCGVTTPDSLANFDLDTSSWKTSQRCLIEGLQRYSENWPRSGMTRNGTAYRLPTWAPLTDEIEYGLLPTPTATNYGSNQGGAAGRTGPIRHSLQSMAKNGLWPTPNASDNRSRGTYKSTLRRIAIGKQINLEAMVKMWPTPTASCVDIDTMQRQTVSGYIRKAMKAAGTPYQTQVTGMLNPTWVEWLMGFPLGWTVCEAWETRSSRKSRKSSAAQL